MILKKCAQCNKDIPSSMAVCPYCRRDESGQEIVSAEQAAPALDAQVPNDLKQLASDDPFIRGSAADRLSQRGSLIVPVLINLLQEHSHKGVVEAARLLGRMRDRRAVAALTQAVKIGNEDLRTMAVWALSQINDPQALEELLHESERNNPAVQSYIAHVMAGYHDPRVVPALMKMARHSSREVAFQAIWALGQVGDKSAISILRQVLGLKDPLLKAAAGAGLRRLGGPVRRAVPRGVWLGVLLVGVATLTTAVWLFYR